MKYGSHNSHSNSRNDRKAQKKRPFSGSKPPKTSKGKNRRGY